ncbi:hypothetical protein [Niallia taxi]|uniref:hypothetical protein n=1 Tax=Niallia taxi TaxID=2499688 RepID=UPI0030090D20
MNYQKYLNVKEKVISEDATVMYVAEKLGIPSIVARFLVKDWLETNDSFKQKE